MSHEEALKKQYSGTEGPQNQMEIDMVMSARKAVEKATDNMLHVKLNEQPRIERKPLIKWEGKMRILKPQDCAFVSVIALRHQNVKIRQHQIHGFIIVYIPENTADMLMRSFGLGGGSEDDCKDACGEFLNICAGLFKHYLVDLKYEELEISPPQNFGFHVDELYDYIHITKFELVFYKEGASFLTVDIGLDCLGQTLK